MRNLAVNEQLREHVQYRRPKVWAGDAELLALLVGAVC